MATYQVLVGCHFFKLKNMLLKVIINLISEEMGGQDSPINNGYICIIKTHSSSQFPCKIELPHNRQLESGQKYYNVGVEILSNVPDNVFKLNTKIYFYSNSKLIAEGFIEKIV